MNRFHYTRPVIAGIRAHWPAIAHRLRGRRVALFLDFDGTLSPIVGRPDDAALRGRVRRVLMKLAGRCPIAVVSGRARADVASRIAVPALIYAGDHGFDISGPGLSLLPEIADADVEQSVAAAAQALTRQLSGIKGVIVEAKRFSVAVHYRLVDETDMASIDAAVAAVTNEAPALRCFAGKKVYEIRPTAPWDKGNAVIWLLHVLGLGTPNVVPIYIGDDTTDEDAFRALRGRGITVLVARRSRPSFADYRLRDPDEVLWFLERLSAHLRRRHASYFRASGKR